MKLKITVHGVAYEVDVQVLDAKDEMTAGAGAPLPPSPVSAPPPAPVPAASAAAPPVPVTGGVASPRSPWS